MSFQGIILSEYEKGVCDGLALSAYHNYIQIAIPTILDQVNQHLKDHCKSIIKCLKSSSLKSPFYLKPEIYIFMPASESNAHHTSNLRCEAFSKVRDIRYSMEVCGKIQEYGVSLYAYKSDDGVFVFCAETFPALTALSSMIKGQPNGVLKMDQLKMYSEYMTDTLKERLELDGISEGIHFVMWDSHVTDVLSAII